MGIFANDYYSLPESRGMSRVIDNGDARRLGAECTPLPKRETMGSTNLELYELRKVTKNHEPPFALKEADISHHHSPERALPFNPQWMPEKHT
jgi:hypothetical protein